MKLITRIYIFIISLVCISFFSQAQIPNQLKAACWISPSFSQNGTERPPVTFEKSFQTNKPIRSAKLYITSHGIYEARTNGQRVAEDYFTPGYTTYEKRLQYQVYEIKDQLAKSNSIKVTVADGWWRGYIKYTQNNYGTDLALLCALEIIYTDNSSEIIQTDKSWTCASGKIRYSDMYNGEKIDKSYITKEPSAVEVVNASKDILIPSSSPAVKKHERFTAIKSYGDSIYDFGQNIAGWIRFNVQGQRKDSIVIKYAEVLDNSNDLYTKPLRAAKATDVLS